MNELYDDHLASTTTNISIIIPEPELSTNTNIITLFLKTFLV